MLKNVNLMGHMEEFDDGWLEFNNVSRNRPKLVEYCRTQYIFQMLARCALMMVGRTWRVLVVGQNWSKVVGACRSKLKSDWKPLEPLQ